MRKSILSLFSLFTVIMLLASCGAQRKGATSSSSSSQTTTETADGPSATQWKSGVKGTWVLKSVNRQDIPETLTIKNIFDEAPVDCFIGSVWNLPTGNYRGTITFNANGTLCANGAVRTIIWSIYNPGKLGGQPQFQFKKLYAGDKASNVTTGYRMDLSFANEESLVMKMPVDIGGGSTGYLVFNFDRQAN